jgi:alcohol dehydrogenase
VLELRTMLSIPNKLRDLGVEAGRIDDLTKLALEDPSVGGNPVAMTFENTRALFEATI